MINWGLLVLILYALYYAALEPVAGLSWGVLLGVPMWLTATAFYQHVPHAWAWALGLHILSWFLQVHLSPQPPADRPWTMHVHTVGSYFSCSCVAPHSAAKGLMSVPWFGI